MTSWRRTAIQPTAPCPIWIFCLPVSLISFSKVKAIENMKKWWFLKLIHFLNRSILNNTISVNYKFMHMSTSVVLYCKRYWTKHVRIWFHQFTCKEQRLLSQRLFYITIKAQTFSRSEETMVKTGLVITTSHPKMSAFSVQSFIVY